MATFNPKSFEKKLKSLDPTQTAIQTLSLWILHHRHHAEPITTTWLEQIRKTAEPKRKLGLFYLVNDVVQNGRRKAKELVTAFGGVLLEALPLLRDPKIKTQIERVFNIWLERNVYDGELIDTFKQRIEPSPVKAKPEKKVTISKEKTPVVQRKTVPATFKVSSLLVSIKKATNYDNEVDRKSNALEKLKIDASSFDSVKHVKDRSSVGRFHKQFEESKILLEDYIQTLRRCQRDKIVLMALLSGSEVFYEVAQEEAKVIVNAYKTFGNRLNSMKKKLDSKIRRMEEEAPVSSSQSEDNVTDDNSDIKGPKYSVENSNIQDMDLDSESDSEVTDRYSLSNTMHTLDDTGAGESFNNASSASSQDESFQLYQDTEMREEGNNQSLLIQPPGNIFATPESQKEQQDFLSFHNQLLLSQQKQSMSVTMQTDNRSLQRQSSIPGIASAKHTQPDALAMIGLAKQTLPMPNDSILDISKQLQTHIPASLVSKHNTMEISPRMMVDTFTQRQASQSSHEQSPPPIGMPIEGQTCFNGVTSIYDFPGMPVSSSLTMGDESIVGSSENSSIDLQSVIKPNRCSDNSANTPDGLVISEENDGSSFQVLTNKMNPDQSLSSLSQPFVVNSNLPTPVLDEFEKNTGDKIESMIDMQKKQQPLQSLIDSLFPVLSKSLQTIKEKQQAADEGTKPSVTEAMAFALGSPTTSEDVPRKKSRFAKDLSPSPVTSPLSLTNPKGLSENQTELISIAAGLTKFDENFLPVTIEESVDTEPTEDLEELAMAQAPVESAEEEQIEHVHEEAPKDKDTEEHEKKREDRKSRHSRHSRSSHKDEERRKHSSSSPSRRSSHREDDRHKRSSSRSPSRRNSHRSSRDSRDDRHSERRRSRRSQSPRRRKSNRGRRSTSREREDAKRRRSPDRAPYYNDRRSPTPEMDSSPRPQPFATNVISNQIVNPIIQNTAFQLPPSTISAIQNHNLEDQNQIQESPNGPAFLGGGVVLNPGMFQSSDEAGLTVSTSTGPNNMITLTSNSKDDELLNNGGKTPDITTILQMANQLRPLTMPLNQSSLDASVGHTILNYDSVGRPMILPGIQIRNPNPVQVLQSQGEQTPGILHIRPLPPGLISINTGQNIIGGMSGPMLMQENSKPMEHNLHDGEPKQSPSGSSTTMIETPIQKLSKMVQQEEEEQLKRDSLLQSFENPPHVPVNSEQTTLLQRSTISLPPPPPPVPPTPPEFRPRFGGNMQNIRFDDDRSIRSLEPRFNGPPNLRFDGSRGPRIEEPRGPRFDGPRRPRFDGRGPHFDGPRRPRFDGPRGPRFDGPRPRFEVPQNIRHDGERFDGPLRFGRPRFDGPLRFNGPPRFEGPRPRFDGPRPRFDGPRPRFDGPRPRFDGPRPRFDGPPTRFDGPSTRFDGPHTRFDGPSNSRFDRPRDDPHMRIDGPRDENSEKNGDAIFDELEARAPKCAEPDPLLDQLEAQQKQDRQHSSPPPPQLDTTPPRMSPPREEPLQPPPRPLPPRPLPPRPLPPMSLPPRGGHDYRPKFRPATFSEVRPFHEPRPRFRPRFSGPRGFRFRPRFERRPQRFPRPVP